MALKPFQHVAAASCCEKNAPKERTISMSLKREITRILTKREITMMMTDPQIPKDVEETVGAWVGIAAILHIQGVNELITDGHVAAETKQRGAEMLTHLSMLRLDG